MKSLEELFKKLTDRSAELNTWLLHSEIVCYSMKVRVCEDIVVLLQHKNLIAEYNGRRFIKVGVIEKELGIMMRITNLTPANLEITSRASLKMTSTKVAIYSKC